MENNNSTQEETNQEEVKETIKPEMMISNALESVKGVLSSVVTSPEIKKAEKVTMGPVVAIGIASLVAITLFNNPQSLIMAILVMVAVGYVKYKKK